jgi:hypothetical protein
MAFAVQQVPTDRALPTVASKEIGLLAASTEIEIPLAALKATAREVASTVSD